MIPTISDLFDFLLRSTTVPHEENMFVLMMLLLTLEFQHFTPPDEAIIKSFVVSPLQNEALTGCATDTVNGKPINTDLLAADGIRSSEYDMQHTATWTSAIVGPENESGIVPVMLVLSSGDSTPTNPPLSNPNPVTPPVPIAPEPSTVAILGITAALLLFLLFGRRRFVRQ